MTMKITTKAFDKSRDVYDGIELRLRKYIPKKYAQYIVVAEYWGGDYDAVVCQGARVTATDSHTCIGPKIDWFLDDVRSIVIDEEDDEITPDMLEHIKMLRGE